jgi:putative aldouronate transport system permease protein
MIKKTTGEKIFDLCNVTFLAVLMMVTLYPFIYVVFASISDPAQIIKNTGILWRPVGFTLEAYKLVLTNPMIAIGYKNTLFIVLIGTVLNVLATAIFAYVLSRKDVYWKNTMMFLVIFTLFFSGGLIPEYILVKNLGLLDTRWSLIFPGLIATWNLIIMRTSFMSVPYELEESAKIDGAGEVTIFFRIIIPLQTSVIAVMFLFYGVSHWNAWANAMIFLKDRDLFPLQLVLREILIINATGDMTTEVTSSQDHALSAILKYATIIVATLPILVVYPLIQRHFTKGVMIGALKG